MKIYLAGKIAKGDWRHDLVIGLREAVYLNDESALQDNWPTLDRSIVIGDRAHDYVGPYFLSDDHGCAHGPNSHGCGVGNGCGACVDDVLSVGDRYELHDGWTDHARSWIVKQCARAIRECDLFFAWIEDGSAYGTLVELGMAHAMGKTIFATGPGLVPGSPEDMARDDMWFAFNPSISWRRFKDPRSALEAAVHEVSPNFRMRERVAAAMARCESPIERAFLSAFAEHPNAKPPTGPDEIFTVQVGDSRLDFHQQITPHGHPYRLDFALTGDIRIAVELDGHEFHERTKEQAERDKRRDRELTASGWRTLRFTGSEVYRNAAACVQETVKVAQSIMAP